MSVSVCLADSKPLIQPDCSSSLADWLAWLEHLHPTAMDLTLERAASVVARLSLQRPGTKVVTVAGTNGKGSTVRLLETALRSAGLRVGSTSSPHLFRFNERICIDGIPASDQAVVRAFEAVNTGRNGTTLTYYEYGIIAALWLMREAQVDVALLEVGLGGRLDAVNIIDADIAVITHIGIDHVAILGADRETIGAEKAGIFRPGQLGISGDSCPPASVLDAAHRLGVYLKRRGEDFGVHKDSKELNIGSCKLPLCEPRLAMDNVLTALAVLGYGFPELDLQTAYEVMIDTELAGRMQCIDDTIWLDVCHNPDGARHLAGELGERLQGRRLYCLYATLADKDALGFVKELKGLVDGWYLGATTGTRGRQAAQLAQTLSGIQGGIDILATDEDLMKVCQRAVTRTRAGHIHKDALLVCGSFESVARTTQWLTENGNTTPG